MRIASCLMSLFLLLGCIPPMQGGEPSAAQPKFNVLVIGSKIDAELEKRLAADGIGIVPCNGILYNAEQLKQFDAVLLSDFTGIGTPLFAFNDYILGYVAAKQTMVEVRAALKV